MFEKGDDSSNRQKLNSCSFQQVLIKTKFEPAFVLTLSLRDFILEPTERAQVFLKKGTRDFQNSPLFE